MRERAPQADPSRLRGATERRLNRRDLLRIAGLAGAGAALAACGGNDPRPQADFWTGKVKNGRLDFANWAFYIDPDRSIIKDFTAETGTTVNYREVITENKTWFDSVQPKLAAGQPIGYDLMVVTNGPEFDDLVDGGYVAPLAAERLPNFDKYAGIAAKSRSYDSYNRYSIPYTSGMTGIAYNANYVKRDINSWQDLLDPAFKGKVGMFTNAQELGNAGMFMIGVDPERSTPTDWRRAAEKLRQQRPLVGSYSEDGWVERLKQGELWIHQAWSGDIAQANRDGDTGLKFVFPKEGATIWTDNMMIPKTAPNPVDALAMMDYFYRPEVAARLNIAIGYVSPVPSSREAMLTASGKAGGAEQAKIESLASSPLVFPTQGEFGRMRRFRKLAKDERETYQGIFHEVTGG